MQKVTIYFSEMDCNTNVNGTEVFLGYKQSLLDILQIVYKNEKHCKSGLVTKDNEALSFYDYGKYRKDATYRVTLPDGVTHWLTVSSCKGQ